MNRMTLAPLLVCRLLLPSAWGHDGDVEQERAIFEIQKLGGTIQRDEIKPGQPVVGVELDDDRVFDEEWAHLEKLTGLETLDLGGLNVTDAGLAHLEKLTGLKE